MNIVKIGKQLGNWVGACALLAAAAFLAGCSSEKYSELQYSQMPGVTVTPSGTTTNPALAKAVESAPTVPTAMPTTPTTANPTPPAAAPVPYAGSEILRVGDSMTITFADTVTPILPFDVTIKEDGAITLMQNQTFTAAGKTPGQLEKEIRERYVPKYFVNLTVTIKTQERFYFVDGEVKSPSKYVYSSGMTVLKAIASAGGFTDYANKKKVKLTRQDNTTQTINCVKAVSNPRLDVEVLPGDKILVPRTIL